MGEVRPSPVTRERNRVCELNGECQCDAAFADVESKSRCVFAVERVWEEGDSGKQKRWRRKFVCSLLGFGSGLFLAVAVGAVGGEPGGRIQAALAVAADDGRDKAERIASIRRLGRADYRDVDAALLKLLNPRQDEDVRLAVVRTLNQIADPDSVAPLLHGWREHSPTVRQAITHAITSRKVLAARFLDQLEAGAFAFSEVDSSTRKRLESLGDPGLAARATRIFKRQPLLNVRFQFARHRGALMLKGNPQSGRTVFRERSCFNCHRLGGEGVFVGADLFTVQDMSGPEMLRNILSPNLFFMPNFQVFVAEDEDGELVEGLLAGSNSVTVTLRRALGDESVLPKKSIRRLNGINVSLMPEGLLEGLTDQQVADLLAFIKSAKGDEGVGIRLSRSGL